VPEVILYSPEDLAKSLQVTTELVRVWLRKKKIKGFKPAGSKLWRITAEEYNHIVSGNNIKKGHK